MFRPEFDISSDQLQFQINNTVMQTYQPPCAQNANIIITET